MQGGLLVTCTPVICACHAVKRAHNAVAIRVHAKCGLEGDSAPVVRFEPHTILGCSSQHLR